MTKGWYRPNPPTIAIGRSKKNKIQFRFPAVPLVDLEDGKGEFFIFGDSITLWDVIYIIQYSRRYCTVMESINHCLSSLIFFCPTPNGAPPAFPVLLLVIDWGSRQFSFYGRYIRLVDTVLLPRTYLVRSI